MSTRTTPFDTSYGRMAAVDHDAGFRVTQTNADQPMPHRSD